MKDPADSVVDELGFRKGLVTTFVSNDPEAGCWQAGGESIERPERIIENRVESRMRQRNVFRRDELLCICGRLVDEGDGDDVADTKSGVERTVYNIRDKSIHVYTGLESRTFEAVFAGRLYW